MWEVNLPAISNSPFSQSPLFLEKSTRGLKHVIPWHSYQPWWHFRATSFLLLLEKYHVSPPPLTPGSLHIPLSLLEMLFLACSLSRPSFPRSTPPHRLYFQLCSCVTSFTGGNLTALNNWAWDLISALDTSASMARDASTSTTELWLQSYICICIYLSNYLGLLQWLSDKELVSGAGASGELGSIPDLGRSLGGGHSDPLQDSCLENPMDRGAWQARVSESQTQLEWLSTHMNKQLCD